MSNPIPSDHHFFTITDLLERDLSYYKINKLVEQGCLKKLSNKLYENTTYEGDVSDFSVVVAYAPKSVLCMMTAARYYGLTTYLPEAVDVAIERSMKITTLPEHPPVNVWYFPKTRYEFGITTITDEAGEYRMYDVEKTVADVLYYRNKIGIEETKQVLKNYLDKDDRNLILLHRYADELKCGKILTTYLEVLL